MKRREFISVFGVLAAASSLAAHAQESAMMRPTGTLPQIEVARVKPVDRSPPNLRLSDDLIDLMKDFSLSSAQAIGGAWGYHCARRRPSTSATGNGEITLSPAAVVQTFDLHAR